jgi:4-amino-4-deoxy-L-arabinose transferase-like glycosyltransferase
LLRGLSLVYQKIRNSFENCGPEAFWPLFLGGIVLYLQNSWVPGMFHDGYLYAALGKNAAELNHWLVPHLTENLYPQFEHHLPFVFMLEGLFFKVFGASNSSARIFGSLFGLLTLTVIYFWLRSEKRSWAYYSSLVFLLTLPIIKKMRFPNLDMPLMAFIFLSLSFYWQAFKKDKIRDWLLCGLFFGLALLTKGPMGMIVPLVIFVHILSERKWDIFKSYKVYSGFLAGIMVFSSYLVSLYLAGKFHIFLKYWDFTMNFTIKDGRGESSPIYTYIAFLFKYNGPWLILAAIAVKKLFTKDSRTPKLLKFFAIFSFCILIPLSFAKFKYSHYLIPIYPAISVLAGFTLMNLGHKFLRNFVFIQRLVFITLTLILLVFPLTNVSKRDVLITKSKNIISQLKETPKKWANVNRVYPYYAMANYNSWDNYSFTYNLGIEQLNFVLSSKDESLKNWVVVIHSEDIKKLSTLGQNSLRNSMRSLYYDVTKKIFVYVHKDLFY